MFNPMQTAPRPGDIVTYEPFGGGRRVVLVINVYDEIKNGQPGFDGRELEGGGDVWGYNSQIIRIEEGA